MLASGILRLRHLYGVAAGERIVVVTDDDRGWWSAAELVAAGLPVVALVDVRALDASSAAGIGDASGLPAAGIGHPSSGPPCWARPGVRR